MAAAPHRFTAVDYSVGCQHQMGGPFVATATPWPVISNRSEKSPTRSMQSNREQRILHCVQDDRAQGLGRGCSRQYRAGGDFSLPGVLRA